MKRVNVTRLILMCAICAMSVLMCGMKCKAATQTEALQWVKAQVGKSIDTDGYPVQQPYQCVDLIKAYYSYLGVSPVTGNGCDYSWNSLPSGWTRIKGGTPQPGDVLVYAEAVSGDFGHVAIYESNYSTYHQNVGGAYVKQITNIAYNGFDKPYWGVIRPAWSSSSTPVNLGDSFYAIILRTDVWQPIKCVDDNVVLSSTEKHISQEHWKFMRQSDGSYVIQSLYNGKVLDVFSCGNADGTNVWLYEQGDSGNTAQKWYIYASGSGYKLVPQCATDKALDVAGGGSADGTNIQIYTQNASAAQIFSIYKFKEKGMTSLSFDESSKRLVVGEEYNASYSSTPSDVTYNGITWKSSDTSVATVNSSGVITAVSKGTATITVTSVYNDQLSDTIEIEVVEECEIKLCEWDNFVTPAGKEARVTTCQVFVSEVKEFSSIKVITTTNKNGVELKQENEFGPRTIESVARFMFVVDRSDFDNADGDYTTTAILTENDGTITTKSVTYNFANFSDSYHLTLDVGETIDLETATGFDDFNACMFKINDSVSIGSISKSSDSKTITGVTSGRVYAAFINLSFATRTLVIVDVVDPSDLDSSGVDDDSEQDSNEDDGKNDSEQDTNVDDGKSDSEKDSNVDDGKGESGQDKNQDADEDIEDSQKEEELDSEEPVEVGSEVQLSTGCYEVTNILSGREVAYTSSANTKKTSITIPATVTIDGYTYKVTEIAQKAFKNNKKLKSVTIGKNVKKIGKEAFYNCKKIKRITIKSANLKSVGKNAIKGINKKATIKVPKKQLKKYKRLFKSKTGYKKSMKIKK